MRYFIVICCNSRCADHEFNRLARIVCKIPTVDIIHRCISDGRTVVRFMVNDDANVRRLHGLNIVDIHTCNNTRYSEFIEAANAIMKRNREVTVA